jgi:hypothetical protein
MYLQFRILLYWIQYQQPTISVGTANFNCDGTGTTTVTVTNAGSANYTYEYLIDGVVNTADLRCF